MNKYKTEVSLSNLGKRFKIEDGGDGVGYYLYVFDLNSGDCIADHLQDSIEMAIDDAFEYYSVPKNTWDLK